MVVLSSQCSGPKRAGQSRRDEFRAVVGPAARLELQSAPRPWSAKQAQSGGVVLGKGGFKGGNVLSGGYAMIVEGGGQRPTTTEGEGHERTHVHRSRVHSHDHYHVSHHHGGGVLGEWEHRTYWHTHEHNHTELRHSHDYTMDDEEEHHGKEAHVHDHAAPADEPL